MRLSLPLVLVLLSCLVTSACRTTRDVESDELESLDTVSDSFWGADGADSDQGEMSVGQLSGNYLLLMALSQERQQNDGLLGESLFGMRSTETPQALATWAESGRFLSTARDAWPDCVTQVDDGVDYDECEYGFAGDSGSISFMLDGSYLWGSNEAVADLSFDFALLSDEISIDWVFDWDMDIDWTDTTLDGQFDVNYGYGVALGGTPPLGARTFRLHGTIDQLTSDDACEDGPVAGVLDWTATRQDGMDPPENKHVTIEWSECGVATITM